MILKGRNLIEPTVRVHVENGTFYFRIDDKRVLSTWIEIEITQAELDQLTIMKEAIGEPKLGQERFELKNETETT